MLWLRWKRLLIVGMNVRVYGLLILSLVGVVPIRIALGNIRVIRVGGIRVLRVVRIGRLRKRGNIRIVIALVGRILIRIVV